ncbi:MAG: cache domain-containing protein [Desulfobacterales bacterium]
MEAKIVKNWFQTIPIRILLPVVLTVVLFVGTIFLLILPILQDRMMNDKREMIRELTETAWSVLNAYRKKEISGQMSPADARGRAVEELRRLRYGPESKDYFWINDMHPYLIMHPYRPDLEGKDISGFSDPNGKKLFVEFVKTVKNGGAGYVDYQWQWKDDPQRIVPKISYVKGFDPWRWIIGTGIYVEDVRAEIAAITRRLTAVCLAILLLIIGLSSYVIWQSAGSQRRQRLADEALRESEEKYRLLAETAREFILAFEPGGRITYVNRAWREASGYDVTEMLTMTIFDIMASDEKPTFQDRLDLLYSGGTAPDLFETGLTVKSGKRIPVEATLASLMDAGNAVRIFITARDVTEKKRAENQARRQQEQLFQADKMATLGTLVSGVAHEINNPATFIMLNAPILQQAWQAVLPILDDYNRDHGDFKVGRMDYSRLRERIPLLLANISDGTERIKTIVGELKDFARQGPSEMVDQVEINPIVVKAVGLVGNLIKRSTHHFSVQYGPDIPRVKGNSQKIGQVVINLLVNACQALPDPERAIRLATTYEANAGQAVIEVTDEGCGMSEEVLQRIRNPFFTTKRESGGTGLGLAIADRIVEDHGGSMRFTSTVNQGTTARVHLPVTGPVSSDQKESS